MSTCACLFVCPSSRFVLFSGSARLAAEAAVGSLGALARSRLLPAAGARLANQAARELGRPRSRARAGSAARFCAGQHMAPFRTHVARSPELGRVELSQAEPSRAAGGRLCASCAANCAESAAWRRVNNCIIILRRPQSRPVMDFALSEPPGSLCSARTRSRVRSDASRAASNCVIDDFKLVMQVSESPAPASVAANSAQTQRRPLVFAEVLTRGSIFVGLRSSRVPANRASRMSPEKHLNCAPPRSAANKCCCAN